MSDNKRLTTLIFVVALAIVLVAGGTLAYVNWQTSSAQATLVNVTASDEIRMIIDDTTISSTKLYPTSDCNLDASMQGVANVTVINNTGVLASPNFKLKVKIEDKNGNIITNNDATGNAHEYRYYIKFAVGEENDECTEPLYSGRFELNTPTKTAAEGWYDSGAITLEDANGFPIVTGRVNEGVSFYANKYATTNHRYKVWAWIDQEYVATSTGNSSSDLLQDAKITVSWSENSIVEQVRKGELEGEAIAIYSSADNSLRFYRVDDPTNIGDTYNGLTVTEVYTGIETVSYTYAGQIPWHTERDDVRVVYFEDYIRPVSTAYWFYEFVIAEIMDVTKLDMSNVTNMSYMFSNSDGWYDLIGLENWDTSNVTNMSYMFNIVYIGTDVDLSNWDVSSVTNMDHMFYQACFDDDHDYLFYIGDISNWDTSNVTNMNNMFQYVGDRYNVEIDIGNISGWNVCRVTTPTNFTDPESGVNHPNWGMDCPS